MKMKRYEGTIVSSFIHDFLCCFQNILVPQTPQHTDIKKFGTVFAHSESLSPTKVCILKAMFQQNASAWLTLLFLISKELDLLATLACREARTSPVYTNSEFKSSSPMKSSEHTPYVSPHPPRRRDYKNVDEYYAAYMDRYNQSPPYPCVCPMFLFLFH